MARNRSGRHGGQCACCKTFRVSLHRDHILPKYKGGLDTSENIQYICANCHEDKTREDMKGKPVSAESRSAISRKNLVYLNRPEVKEKMRIAHLGKTLSVETRTKLSAIRRGVKKSPQWCANISAALRGRKFSEETRLKMSLAKIVNHNSNDCVEAVA